MTSSETTFNDAELSISDATLIARLRESQSYEWQDAIWETRLAAADRIEQLAVTNEQLVATNEALTAKLEKAVEALEVLIQLTHDCEKELTEDLYHVDFCGESEPLTKARATLVEIKEGNQDGK